MDGNEKFERYLIKCPHCGAEYLPNEIFIEGGLLGDAHNILKTSLGQVISFKGNYLDLNETYVCDYCNKPFIIVGKVSFETFAKQEFEEDYVKEIYENRVELQEE